jgi:hypothetical protein
MKRSAWWAWALAANAAAIVVVAACVGEDPPALTRDPNAKPGEFRGPCDQGRCFTGLRCNIELDICERDPDAGANDDGAASSSGGTSGTSSSGGSSSGGSSGSGPDGGSSSGCIPGYGEGSTTQRLCLFGGGNPCAGGSPVCCLAEDASTCFPNADLCATTFAGGTGRPIDCIGSLDQCGSGQLCCAILQNATLEKAQCNTVGLAQFISAKCTDGTMCSGGSLRVCRNDNECGSAKCTKLTVSATAGTVTLGLCL